MRVLWRGRKKLGEGESEKERERERVPGVRRRVC